MSNEEIRASVRKRIIIAAAAFILLLVGLLCWRVFSSHDSSADDPAQGGLVYDDSAIEGGWETLSEEEIEAALNEKVEEGYINISMNTSPVFADGKSEGNLMIVNETANRYPQRVIISRNDTGETIYTSGAIPVGSKIANHTLDVELAAGSYECTAMFHSLDPDTGAVLGSAGAIITITIQN